MEIEDFGNLCMGCMQDKGNHDICPRCGYQMDRWRSPAALPYQAVLNNKFLVGRILGKPGGFGITYLAWDLVLHTAVAIKEYLPLELATRDANRLTVVPYAQEEETDNGFIDGLRQFLNEARTLSKFSHPNVVRVREFFEQNKTAYMVMDYYEGVSLEEYVKRHGGALDEAAAMALMSPILDGLREVHAKGFLHRDIKPANIYLTKGGVPILLDFGAARLVLHGQRSQPLSVILTPGFAPFEQYLEKREFGPTVDIYAVGATLYYLVTGKLPLPSVFRVQKDELIPPIAVNPALSSGLNHAILGALALDAGQRPQSIDELRALLFNHEAKADSEPSPPMPALGPKQPAQARCPRCKARNPVSAGADLHKVFCSKCGNRLAGSGRGWQSQWGWGLLAVSALSAVLLWPPKQADPPATSQSGDGDIPPQGSATPPPPGEDELGLQPEDPESMPEEGLTEDNRPAASDGDFDGPLPPPPPQERSGGHLPPYPPPQNAIDTCEGKAPGAACELPSPEGRRRLGLCRQIQDYFACAPEGPAPSP